MTSDPRETTFTGKIVGWNTRHEEDGDWVRTSPVLELQPDDESIAVLPANVTVCGSAALDDHDRKVRAEALRAAEVCLRQMAGPWGDDQMWITTGTKVAAVAGDVIKELRGDEEAGR